MVHEIRRSDGDIAPYRDQLVQGMTHKNLPMKIGLISDTHGYFDPGIVAAFGGVSHILHAGDIGNESVILSLEAIAPVAAVLGNTDYDLPYPETKVIELGGRRFFICHVMDPYEPERVAGNRLSRAAADVVVFGHSHKPFAEAIGSTLFINPGYSGKQRFNLPRSVAVLSWMNSALKPEFINL